MGEPDRALRRPRRPLRARVADAGADPSSTPPSVTRADPAFRPSSTSCWLLRRPSESAHRLPPPVEELGCRVLLKREDLNHTGSHKINNVLGQALLARRMGKTRLVAETGAGQHGVATATAAALLGMDCLVGHG